MENGGEGGGKTCIVDVDNIKTVALGAGGLEAEPLAAEDFKSLMTQLLVGKEQRKDEVWEGLGFEPHPP